MYKIESAINLSNKKIYETNIKKVKSLLIENNFPMNWQNKYQLLRFCNEQRTFNMFNYYFY